ncbi:MAG: tRNA (N(6)-L-threonylcarbamoyladenosine(37)-C(2))-methylthiotransferase MtaB [Lachnospiraceae bacterium]
MDYNEETGLKNRKIAFLTLGCKVNFYETEAMQALLKAAGATVVEFEETADIYIVNTCSVTNMADRKSRQMLHRAKKKNPQAVVVAVGCYAQTASEEDMQATGIDLVIGNNQKKEIVTILNRYVNGVVNQRLDIAKESDYEELHLDTELRHTRAYIKIQDGCNQFCSYCIIPYARGRIRSRSAEDVLEEVQKLAKAGYKEIVLTGIHLSSYGQPAGENEQPLLALIEQLNRIEGIERIRLGSLEPRIMTENFVKTLSSYEKVCPHFHLSLQSGSDTVLKRMNRKYTTSEYLESVRVLRRFYELPAITTDIIVGFPQETEEEFEETLEFARTVAFSKIHVFKYSRRKGTVADKMSGQIPEQKKAERSERLIKLEEELGQMYRKQFTGTVQKVLFEEHTNLSGEDFQTGYNERYVRIAVKSDTELSGRIAGVQISNTPEEQETLFGEILF